MKNPSDIPLKYIAFSRLRAFAKAMNPIFDADAYHIKLIAQALEDVESRKIKRLMIFMPPRHGKSFLASEMFPAWYLGRNPSHQIIFTTYNQSFATTFGRKVRNHLSDPTYKDIFPTTVLSDDSQSAQRFDTTRGGVYNAVGMDGSVTGKGAHLFLIDDPIKNAIEANSSKIRQNHKDFFSSTAYTRLEPNAAIVIVQTRWHNDDLSGWLLEENNEEWHVISIPAITIDEEGNQKALWPERYSIDTLLKMRDSMLTHDWNALYMQAPVKIGGDAFQLPWLQFYDETPSHAEMNKYIIVDPANSKDAGSDNTAIAVLGANKDGKLYVLDMDIDKFNYKERQDRIFDLVEKYQPKTVYMEEYGMQADIQHLKAEMDRRNYRFSVTSIGGNAKGAARKLNKQDRIMQLQQPFQDGKIYLPRFLTKINYLGKTFDVVNYFMTKEYSQFTPANKDQRDDMLDCLSRIFDITIMYPGQNTVDYHALYR